MLFPLYLNVNFFFFIENRWSIKERWLHDINISALFDTDTSSCLNLAGVTSILTLQYQFLFSSGIYVSVVLPENLEHYRNEVIRVLIQEQNDNLVKSCPEPARFRKCLFQDGHRYFCSCDDICQLLVKISFVSQWATVITPLSVCEIEISIN